jgi:hypothetical protein
MLAGIERCQGQIAMRIGRGRDNDGVDPRIAEKVASRVAS